MNVSKSNLSNFNLSNFKDGVSATPLKTAVAGLLLLASVSLIGCGRNSSPGPGYGPGPTGIRSTSVVTRGTYVNGRYVEGEARGGFGGAGADGAGAACSVQNLDAALQTCQLRHPLKVKRFLAERADQEGLISAEILSELRLGRRSTQCLGEALCNGSIDEGAPQETEEPEVQDIEPAPEKTIKRKY